MAARSAPLCDLGLLDAVPTTPRRRDVGHHRAGVEAIDDAKAIPTFPERGAVRFDPGPERRRGPHAGDDHGIGRHRLARITTPGRKSTRMTGSTQATDAPCEFGGKFR